jgi:hypothetical protein
LRDTRLLDVERGVLDQLERDSRNGVEPAPPAMYE